MHTGFWWENLGNIYHLGDVDVLYSRSHLRLTSSRPPMETAAPVTLANRLIPNSDVHMAHNFLTKPTLFVITTGEFISH